MKHGRVYGCNALYREFTPYALIATDQPIAKRIQESEYSRHNKFYTRRPISGLGALPVPYFTFSSGPNAAAVAAIDGVSPVYLIGFDMAPTEDGLFNNVYAGTEFYKPDGAEPTFAGNWQKQLVEVMLTRHRTEFCRVIGSTTADIPELNAIENYSTMPMNQFAAWLIDTDW